MVEINLTVYSSDHSQEDLDCTDVVEIAQDSGPMRVFAKLAAPSATPLFPNTDIDSYPSESLEFVEEQLDERRGKIDDFEQEVVSLLNNGYTACTKNNIFKLFQQFETYEEAYQEAIRIERSATMLDGSVTLIIDGGASEEAIERIEQRVQNR
ncbi:hypothetical protein [Halorubrum sp. FL23]|uniref:hypothetical protein n=1 Tax=Halorubrum sp. FL23 TaxID=3458704 RepID=UPI004033B8C6